MPLALAPEPTATVAVRITVASSYAPAASPPVGVVLQGELWMPIPTAPGFSASDRGRVREDESGRVLRTIDRGGRGPHRYLGVRIAGERAPRALHHVVAEAWVGPRPKGSCINHRNGIKCDNRPANLEWASHRANVRHAAALGLYARGERHGTSKLSEDEVREIRRLRGGASAREIGEAYGVRKSTVQSIWSRKNWPWLA